MTATSSALEHFVDLAYRGRHTSASDGEETARKLALELCDAVPILDELALQGLCEFVWAVKRKPQGARRVIGS